METVVLGAHPYQFWKGVANEIHPNYCQSIDCSSTKNREHRKLSKLLSLELVIRSTQRTTPPRNKNQKHMRFCVFNFKEDVGKVKHVHGSSAFCNNRKKKKKKKQV